MVNSNIRIVTSVYHSHRESELGGRSWPEEYYKWTLFNIFNMGLPVTIFCNTDNNTVVKINNIISEFKTNLNDKLDAEIIQHELRSHPYLDLIISNRVKSLEKINSDKVNNPNGFYWTRNETICHSKVIFLKKVFDKYPDLGSVIWLDAGITHWGLNPRCYGGMEINGGGHNYTQFYPHSTSTMFKPSIGEGFKKLLSTNDIFLVGHKNNWYDSNLQWVQAIYVFKNNLKDYIDPNCEWSLGENNKVYKLSPVYTPGVSTYSRQPTDKGKHDPIGIFTKQIIGGIIGVTRSKIDHLNHFYYDHLNFLLNYEYNTLFTEEPILSLYYSLFRPKFLEFSDWSHNVPHNPPNPCTTDGTFTKSFYTVWNDISEYNS